eukprot:14361702-Ditylum_brightwellii.AAC.1
MLVSTHSCILLRQESRHGNQERRFLLKVDDSNVLLMPVLQQFPLHIAQQPTKVANLMQHERLENQGEAGAAIVSTETSKIATKDEKGDTT